MANDHIIIVAEVVIKVDLKTLYPAMSNSLVAIINGLGNSD